MASRGYHYLRAEQLAEQADGWAYGEPERDAMLDLAGIHAKLAGVPDSVWREAVAIGRGRGAYPHEADKLATERELLEMRRAQ